MTSDKRMEREAMRIIREAITAPVFLWEAKND